MGDQGGKEYVPLPSFTCLVYQILMKMCPYVQSILVIPMRSFPVKVFSVYRLYGEARNMYPSTQRIFEPPLGSLLLKALYAELSEISIREFYEKAISGGM